jgi:methyl-accepting chemotaxis protein
MKRSKFNPMVSFSSMRDVSSSVMRHENRRPAFRSAIARRVIGCFAVAALLPVAAIAILSLDLSTSNEFHSTLLAMAAVAALIAAVLGVTDVCRTLRPLEDLREGVRRVGEKDFSVRVDVGRNDEFGDLAASFNSMAARLGGSSPPLPSPTSTMRSCPGSISTG